MATRAIGPKVIVGTILGVMIGLTAAFINIYVAGALVLVLLYLLGRYAPNSPVAQEHAENDREEARARDRRRWLDAQARRNGYWLRFPLEPMPGETRMGRHLDRVFTPYAECDQGHVGFHRMGVLFERDGADRTVRVCSYPGCTCTWSELLIGGVA
ncbi:hypothetical protein [Actinophytocola sp.]|uniref:hypothetical protein n=1 Tax=Actinophytocola sp. TaxID=1872138 RepID=UPI002D7FC5CB|nr:hypothetical protein [Actinophytocola sp.]HET9144110.1 hypothetical protein [Actinophytocola sp.]